MKILVVDGTEERRDSLVKALGEFTVTAIGSIRDDAGCLRNDGDPDLRLALLHISDQRDKSGPSTTYIDAVLGQASDAMAICYSAGGMEWKRDGTQLSMERIDAPGRIWLLNGEVARRVVAVRRIVETARDLPLRDAIEALKMGERAHRIAAMLESADRATPLLAAMVILCQGFLVAVTANRPHLEQRSDVVTRCLRDMGWNDSMPKPPVDVAPEVSAPTWWRQALSGGDLVRSVEAELGSRPAPSVRRLVARILDDSAPIPADLVAEAYYDLSDALRASTLE